MRTVRCRATVTAPLRIVKADRLDARPLGIPRGLRRASGRLAARTPGWLRSSVRRRRTFDGVDDPDDHRPERPMRRADDLPGARPLVEHQDGLAGPGADGVDR